MSGLTKGQAFATLFFSLSIAALASAASTIELTWPHCSFIIYYILFRLKIYLDDLDLFGSDEKKDHWFIVHFVIGVATWFLWVLAAYKIRSLPNTVLPLLLAVALATFLVLMNCVIKKRRQPYTTWLLINITFLVGLGLMAFGWVESTLNNLGLMYSIYASVVLVDSVISKSHEIILRL